AIGLSPEQVDGTIRFSLSEDNTKEEIDYVVEKLQKHIEMIRFFAKKNKR
ncbi:MAG: cysteine desulfurase NifS, partial [Peptostreptococcus sp.]|nr:cysteine desulfurase NifS [Peptostreptococcus sp.]